jgi:hypothetical protein
MLPKHQRPSPFADELVGLMLVRLAVGVEGGREDVLARTRWSVISSNLASGELVRGQWCLNLGASLVVGVVAPLERATVTVNKTWRKARLVRRYRGQDVDPEIDTRTARRRNRRWFAFAFAFVDDCDDVLRGLGHEPHLGNLGMGVLGSGATRMGTPEGTPEGTTQPACFGWRLAAWSV